MRSGHGCALSPQEVVRLSAVHSARGESRGETLVRRSPCRVASTLCGQHPPDSAGEDASPVTLGLSLSSSTQGEGTDGEHLPHRGPGGRVQDRDTRSALELGPSERLVLLLPGGLWTEAGPLGQGCPARAPTREPGPVRHGWAVGLYAPAGRAGRIPCWGLEAGNTSLPPQGILEWFL